MEFNNKKLEKTSKLINYVIAIVLCAFLISLSGKLIDDVDEWKERPTVEEFYNNKIISKKKSDIEKIDAEINLKNEKKSSIKNTIKVVNNNYENAKKSFDNWIEARKTVGSPKEDKEVISRANELDEYFKTQQEWKKELTKITDEIQLLNKDKSSIYKRIDTEKERAYKEREKAIRKYDLKVFLIRLLFILPILLLGIFFIIKFRKHKYWPLFLGFVLFSFYAFFFGLVPYLPSYGGYIRSAVGIIISVLFGIYAINKIRAFIEQKKKELKVSTTERAKKVRTETAEKALDNHMCPSCGKDFIIKKWDKSVGKKNKTETYGIVTNFCRFCGLELFKKCNNCDSENYAHLPFCANCGDHMTDDK
ncbi:zinc ribbon domain-containing protein [Aquimarina pacifica]|uniref:zinc ribbon domain-containing protein n=1 Tax=Aquimarina pacifica TaxID=1296415 RepID=UPI0004705CC2|nr:zinc ribbon domain-containing protein [Aquimarina pacifica]